MYVVLLEAMKEYKIHLPYAYLCKLLIMRRLIILHCPILSSLIFRVLPGYNQSSIRNVTHFLPSRIYKYKDSLTKDELIFFGSKEGNEVAGFFVFSQ